MGMRNGMTESNGHDPLCGWRKPHLGISADHCEQCDLIRQVRADERERVSQMVLDATDRRAGAAAAVVRITRNEDQG